MTSSALAYDAEALIRSLAGVVSAHVHTGPRGIDAIHVTACDDRTARSMAAHVRSALLAGLATPVTPARIHVRVQLPGPQDLPDDHARTNGHASPDHTSGATAPRLERDEPTTGRDREPRQEEEDAREPDAPDAGPRHRVWLVEPRGPRPRLPGRFIDEAFAPADPAPAAARPDADAGLGASDEAGATAVADEVPDADARRASHRPRLVAVDIDRPGDGRVVCRVSVAYGTCVHRAEAVAVDLPGAAAQAAAQAAVRALVDAGLQGLELNGLREVEIAGRDYVLVALRKSDTSRRHRSGSAPIIGSAERSAAEAAVAAACALI